MDTFDDLFKNKPFGEEEKTKETNGDVVWDDKDY